MRKLLTISLLLISYLSEAQVVTSSWADPCTGEVNIVTIPSNGQTVVTIYNQSRVVTAQDITSGVLTSWITSAYQTYSALSPCSQSETQTQATTQAVQQTAQEAAKAAAAATTAATQQPAQTTTVAPTQTQSSPAATTSQPAQTETTNTTTNDTTTQNTGSDSTAQSGNQDSSGSTDSTGGGTDNTSSSSREDASTGDTSQDSQGSTSDQGSEEGSSQTQESSNEESGSSSEGGEDQSSEDSSTAEESTTEESSSEDTSDSENSEAEGGDSEESSNDEQESEEVAEEETKEEESSDKESSEEEDKKEEESSEEETEEESTEEESEEENEETTEEESEEEEEEEKKKKQKNTNPPIVVANISTMESIDGRFATAMTLGISRSSMRGDKNYGLTSMIWSNGKQFMLMGSFSKTFIKDGKAKFVYSAGLMGSKMFTTLTAGTNHSLVFLGDKGLVAGVSVGATGIYLNYEIRDGGLLVDQALLSGAVTMFATKPYNFDRVTVSPMLAVSSPFYNYDMYTAETTINKDLMIITGASANYALTQRFVANLGINVSHNTNSEIRSLLNFTIGSRFSF